MVGKKSSVGRIGSSAKASKGLFDAENPVSDDELSFGEELTSIPRSIHWPATPDVAGDNNELDRITVETFLDTLAEVAVAVARRKTTGDQIAS